MLLWVLRSDLGLTGTKFGCNEGRCGACTVLLDGRRARACQLTVHAVAGRDLRTIEGIGTPGRLDPLQRAFVAHQAFQCGFCTPGMIMAAHALLLANPNPTPDAIVSYLNSNLCRCGAHARIVAAVTDAAAARLHTR